MIQMNNVTKCFGAQTDTQDFRKSEEKRGRRNNKRDNRKYLCSDGGF